MKKIFITVIAIFSCMACTHRSVDKRMPAEFVLGKAQLMDKIKGGWAGQTIGCTYGGPTEFNYCGTMIQDYIPVLWPDGYIKWYYDNAPGLYDDIYMDLTFVDVFDRLGLDAPVDSFAMAFATADYSLWHANQAARYNILHGIMPPASGHWLNNPHAADIDYQIEADFAGLMSPGMPNAASAVSDKIGHIMNYGDGWYGGVYVGAMYSLAFVSNDIAWIVREALKTIPEQSTFHRCISDVVATWEQYPDDWKRAWFECEKKWSSDLSCPQGIFIPLNIDASINSAYIVIGLLYGEGDFFKTIDIATRCGQDSDCNPASAGGIIGTVLGYDRIPDKWMNNLKEVEDRNFAHTDISLHEAYQMGFRQALAMIERNGGKIGSDSVTIVYQSPVAVPYEKGFEDVYPVEKRSMKRWMSDTAKLSFNGTGIVLRGNVQCSDKEYAAQVEVYLDGQLLETSDLPASFVKRRFDLFWKYRLPDGQHQLVFKWLNPRKDAKIWMNEAVIFAGQPVVAYQ